ncbi:hypothetical protein [Natronobacterium gregoryi]|nr:hypothetical protein [Natronobacterium gregoryi]
MGLVIQFFDVFNRVLKFDILSALGNGTVIFPSRIVLIAEVYFTRVIRLR